MFGSPEFADQIYGCTLRFRRAKLESSFQAQKLADYFNGRPLSCVALVTILTIIGIGAVRAFFDPYLASPSGGRTFLLASIAYFIGIVGEILINCTRKLLCLRTVVIGVSSFISCAMYNEATDKVPTFRPGYLPLRLIT